MTRLSVRLAVTAMSLALLAACAGGTQPQNAVPQAGFAPAVTPMTAGAAKHHHPKRVRGVLRFLIPPRKRATRHEHYVSGATMGVLVESTGAGQDLKTVGNLAPLSSNCTAGGGGRVCTIQTEVPVGDDTIYVTTYNKSPVNNQIPANADVLSLGSTTQKVIIGTTPSIVIYLGGVVGSINSSPSFASLPADGSNHKAAFAIAPQDFGNQPIVAGKNDPYNNPITATLTETGGTGHAFLVLNGKASGSTATLNYSTDALQVQYDGGGTVGYFVKVNFSAQGVTSENDQVAPMFVSSASPMYANFKIALQGNLATMGLHVDEAGSPPNSQTYTLTKTGCAGIATSTNPTNTPANAVFDVTGGTTASPVGACSLSVSDGTSAIAINVSNTTGGGSVGLPGSSQVAYPIPGPTSPGQIVVGPDQQMWFATTNTAITSLSTSGSQTPYTVAGVAPQSLTAGPDGAFWLTDPFFNELARYVPSTGSTTLYTTALSIPGLGTPGYITTGADGNLWFTDCDQWTLDRLTINGVGTQMATASNEPQALAAGPVGTDSGMWFVEFNGQYGAYDITTNSFVEKSFGTADAVSSIALEPGGKAMWMTIPLLDELIRVTTDGSYTTTTLTFAGLGPDKVAAGPDGAMYFWESTPDKIGRIDVKTHAINSFTYPSAGSGPVGGIVAGPDGNVWYTLEGSEQVDKLTP